MNPQEYPAIACKQAYLCEFGENYFGSRADIWCVNWELMDAPFKVSRSLSNRSNAKVNKLTEVEHADVMLICVRGQIQ